MKPKIKATRAKLQLQLLSLCLLCLSGKTRCDGNGPAVVTVKQNSDAVLPCSPNTKENIEAYHFEWKKVAQKEVFYYDAGITYDSGRAGQSEEFKGRVSHSGGLTQGNASIIIRNTAVSDSGSYTCDFPDLQPRQTFHIELIVEPAVITVKQDEDALLPCSLSTENIEQGYFYWYKLAQNNETQKDVFQYETGRYTPSFGSQDVGFKDRVSHFPQELEHGNASIIIRKTKMEDDGNYTCVFPKRQTFHIQLVVECDLKDSTLDKKRGTCPNPILRILGPANNGMLLECVVQGASSELKVELKDSSGKILDAKPQAAGRGDIILRATVTKTDNYSCVCKQEKICHQISAYTYVPVNGPTPAKVKEGKDVTLPCSLRTKENIESEMFEWKKEGLKEVFFYGGIHYNGNRPGQSEEFKGRVSLFPEELKHGDASITITNTKMSDSGNYTCDFPRLQPRQTFHIELTVVNDGSGVHRSDAAPKPSVTILKTKDGLLLQCVVRRASPKPKVEWKDSSGKILDAEPQVTDRGGSYDIILQTTVTKAGDYSCVVTQEEINHQTHADIYVPLSEDSGSGAHSSDSTPGWIVAGVAFVLLALVVIILVVVVVGKFRFRLKHYEASQTHQMEGQEFLSRINPVSHMKDPEPEA